MPTEEEIEIVARHLCTQFGMDPDEEVESAHYPTPPAGPTEGSVLLVHPIPTVVVVPRWHGLKARAQDAIMDHRAVMALAERGNGG